MIGSTNKIDIKKHQKMENIIGSKKMILFDFYMSDIQKNTYINNIFHISLPSQFYHINSEDYIIEKIILSLKHNNILDQ